MRNEIITKIQTTYIPDGQGGYTEETVELGSFAVKLGVSNNIAEATTYGVSVEQILKVVSDIPLLEDNNEAYIIIGPAGLDGKSGSGVWRGEEEPPEGFDVWIDPSGEADDPLPFDSIDNNTLIAENRVLRVNTTNDAIQDNTQPITSGGVYTIVGNIEVILESI